MKIFMQKTDFEGFLTILHHFPGSQGGGLGETFTMLFLRPYLINPVNIIEIPFF